MKIKLVVGVLFLPFICFAQVPMEDTKTKHLNSIAVKGYAGLVG